MSLSFTDYLYIPLLAAVIAVYYIVPRRIRWCVLLFVSILFYCTWGIELLPFAIGSTFIAWIAGRMIERRNIRAEKSKAEKGNINTKRIKRLNKAVLLPAVILIIGMLAYTKLQRTIVDMPGLGQSVDFFSRVYLHLAHWFAAVPGIALFVKDSEAAAQWAMPAFFVPLGISYYSMSLVGYLADVYWKKDKAERNFAKLLLFTLYFPKIIEGPISRHKLLAPQLNKANVFEYNRVCFGAQRMLWGFFKKLVIADRLDIFVADVFNNQSANSGSVLLVAAIFSAFDLYCDFSGCMDIVLGTSEIFGITIEENFRRPFFSQSAAEFWRRWHITLGTWFKDYVYMPIATSPKLIKCVGVIRKLFGKRAGKAVMTIIPVTIVWLLTGLWHATGMNYVAWGCYWGLLIMLSTIFAPELKKLTAFLHIDPKSAGYRRFRMIRTFCLFVISRIISYPGSLEDTGSILYKIICRFDAAQLFDGTLFTHGLPIYDFILGIIMILFLMWIESRNESGISFLEIIAGYPIVIRWAIYLLALFAVLTFGMYGPGYNASAFVYMNY